MINITDKAKCSGCTACYSICPKKCIEMKADFEGFLYPQVNSDICVECGLCEKVCPIINKPASFEGEYKSYVLRTKDEKVLKESTSGGFFTDLAKHTLKKGGIVWAATYDEQNRIVHSMVKSDEEKELSKFRGSKYVQSNIVGIFEQIKSQLDDNKEVCFVGTICQIAGLKKYLKKEYNNLLTVDLICHGVPSPLLWDSYIKYQEKKYRSSMKTISFRNKTYGYHSGTMKIEFENGKIYYGSARVDYMLKSFFSEISSRYSCYNCSFKELERCSDISIYDCWHAQEILPERKDDDRGFTNVIVRSEKAFNVIQEVKELYEIYEADTEEAIKYDGIMVRNSAIPHPKRCHYYKNLNEDTLSENVKKYIPISPLDMFIERSKKIVYKLKLLDTLKKIIRK